MAARENTGLQAALIIFVIITIGLAISTYAYFRSAEEAAKEVAAKTAESTDFKKKYTDRDVEVRCLKFMLGWDTTLSDADYDGLLKGLDAAAEVPGAWVLHAGTRRAEDGRIVAAGGRVLDVMAVGADLASARDTAYRAVSCLELAGGHHRSDIALAAARGEIHIPGSDT